VTESALKTAVIFGKRLVTQLKLSYQRIRLILIPKMESENFVHLGELPFQGIDLFFFPHQGLLLHFLSDLEHFLLFKLMRASQILLVVLHQS